MYEGIIKNIGLSLDINARKRVEGSIGINLYSRDIETGVFEFTFVNEEESPMQLDETYAAKIMIKFHNDENMFFVDDMEIVGNVARFVFPHSFIRIDGKVTMYIYLTRGNKTSDVAAITFDVNRSEIDKFSTEIYKVYDKNYEEVLAEFEEAINLTRDEWTDMAEKTRNFVSVIEGKTVDEFVELKMGEKYNNIEQNYITRLLKNEQDIVSTNAQLQQTEGRIDNLLVDGTPTEGNSTLLDGAISADGTNIMSVGSNIRKTQTGELLLSKIVRATHTNFLEIGTNHFDKKTVSNDTLVSHINGEIVSQANYFTSDKIIGSGEWTIDYIRAYAIYKLDGTFVSGENTGSNTITKTISVPFGHYFVFSGSSSNINVTQVNKGSVKLPYEEYGINLPNLKLTEEQLDEITLDKNDSGDVILSKTGDLYTLQSQLNDDTIEIETTRNGSKNSGFNIGYTRINGEVIHPVNDDVTPIRLFYTVGANHGYGVLQVTQSGFNTADLGSQWTDGQRIFTLVTMDGDILQLAPEYTENPDGTISVAYATPVSNLTHVSGATNTSDILVSGHSISELIPSIKSNSVTYVADGKEIINDGVYPCKELQIIEKYDILDYKSIIDYMQSNVGSIYNPQNIEGSVRISNVFTYTKGLNCYTTHGLKALKKIELGRCGFLQSSAMQADGYTRKRFMQNVKPKNGFDFSVGVDLDNFGISTYFYEADLIDPSTLPTHYTDWLYDGNGVKKYGFTMGYIVDKTNSKTADRLVNTTMFWDMRSSKKSYPVAISGGVLDVGDYKNFSGFRNYLTGGDVGQATTLTKVKDKKDVYVYADYNVPAESYSHTLNDELGKTITRIEGDLNSLNDTVDSEGIVLSSTSEISSGVFKLN